MLKSKPSLLLEMIITHQNNSMSKLVEKLKQEYIKPNLMFDPGYFETQHTCELNSIYIEAQRIVSEESRSKGLKRS